MNEWNIQSRAHQCGACTKPFADRQTYHTLLYDEKLEILQRMDVCDGCWQSQFRNGFSARTGFVSHWQGMYEAPPVQAPDAIQKENAETLLRKLIELKDPRHAPAAYILAVMLERKRLLRVKEQHQRDGQRIFVYEQPKTGDLFIITDPHLHLNQLTAVQQDVADLLEHGLPPTASAPEQVSPPAPAGETLTGSVSEKSMTLPAAPAAGETPALAAETHHP